jgi:hypothetical protein
MPPITKEAIEQRKAQLLKSVEGQKADLAATLGAVQDCDAWLAEINRAEESEPPPAGPAKGK